MSENFWADKYPAGVSPEISTDPYGSILDVLDESCRKFASQPAFSNMGKTISYEELYTLSGHFAAYLQNHTDLKPGDRIAVQMPNLIQFPIAVFGAMRAGMVVVNTNPLYTAREMEHQFNDSGAKALVVLANMAALAEEVIPKTSIKHVIVTEVGDMQSPLKRLLVNTVVKRVKKMVPPYSLPQSVPFTKVMKLGSEAHFSPVSVGFDDVAVLQYTGGTTGVAKGAMLTHRNIVSNMMQAKALMGANLGEGELAVAPLPLYHIYAFTFHCMVMMIIGGHNLLITNPRDLPGFIKELGRYRFNIFVGLNTLFVGLCNNPNFRQLDFSGLKATFSGGMALQLATADTWHKVTGCEIFEGFGMTETSPIATINPQGANQVGTIGIPVPSTDLKLIDDEGNDVAIGGVGELCVRGPQVMKGYWQRPEATAETITSDGWLKTGDIATIQEDGYVKIVDRKKDMIVVSGFNVYPNELEDVLAKHPDVVQCAAIGVPDDKTGEAIKVFAVSSNPNLSKEEVIAYFRENVTGYKVPRMVEFRNELPTTNVGKILRRELRDEELGKMKSAS
ncbi:AMP-binding protein [Aestuariirhabdus litorea]|uniref:Long-chain-fatty-acid--CoA ligase n=1 Tax=Aestuariirhabdus litorea TaxID=2528527 RepID=A0A3P3VPX3_9GAMM|nr:AMP-binding protein [Aestuariirhabdus litorea]RRJ84841.1 long-chain fatty acid--CoA ligase [Aestuariirhabdus litorea]RWW98067.1 long-chain fatty acid--CoA ligase [Endozoicomonadaceae bacterium GTF-13]